MYWKSKTDWQIAAYAFLGAVLGVTRGRWIDDGWLGYGVQALVGAAAAVAAFVVVHWITRLRTRPATR